MWWREAQREAGYSTDLGMLHSHLAGGYNGYDFPHQVWQYLEEEEPEVPQEHGYEWLNNVDDDARADYNSWLESGGAKEDAYVYDAPAYTSMDDRGFSRPDWRVHFTDNARDIAEQGFQYGHPDPHGVHLTTYKKNRQKEPGYNFAFPANSRSLQRHEKGKYGNDAVVFMSGALETYHHGDEEYQSIVWGPHVRKDMIFPIFNSHGDWRVEDWRGRELVAGKTREEAIQYVKDNWRMLQNVRNKVERSRHGRK